MTLGSGNVFADLGLPDPEESLVKAELVMRISDVLKARRMTQAEAARLTGLTQPKVSHILRGRVGDVSTDRLRRMLNALGVSVTLVLADEPGWKPGTTSVRDAGRAA